MIRVDISQLLPASTFTYLVAFIPGFFFELPVFLGNPQLVQALFDRVHSGIGLGLWGFLAIAVIVAFVVGVALILFVRFIQRLFGRVYQLRAYTWKKFNEWSMSCCSFALGFMTRRPFWNRPWLARWFTRLHRFSHRQVFRFQGDLKRVLECSDIAMRELLKKRYGIPEDRVEAAYTDVWYWALWTPSISDLRGDMLVVAIHATGWSGFLAASAAHALWNRYYLGFSSLLLFLGVLHDWSVARGLWDPMLHSILKLRFALVALRRTKEATEGIRDKRSRSGTVTVSSGDTAK